MNPLTNDELKAALRKILPQLQVNFSVTKIGLYGLRTATQWASSPTRPDLLVECTQPLGLEFRTLKHFIEDSLGCSINLHTLAMLVATQRELILSKVQYIHA